MVYGSFGHLWRKIKAKKDTDKCDHLGYLPPKPAHRWQRRKRREEKIDKAKQEEITETKIDPWLQLCCNPQDHKSLALFTLPGDPESNELGVQEGDSLVIESLDRTEVWWQAVNTRTGKSGFIPWNYITEEVGIKDVIYAWHEINRRESEVKLSMANLQSGTYLLRPSSNPLRIALSVLCIIGSTRIIKHFSVKYDKRLNAYSISSGKRFTHLTELTNYYKISHGENPPLLSSPMPRSRPPIQSRQLRIPLEKMKLKSHLSRGGRFGSVYKAVCFSSIEQIVVAKKLSRIFNISTISCLAEACHKLHSPFVVHFLGLCEDFNSIPLLLVWEYMPLGSLKDFLIKNNTTIEYIRLQIWLHQILDGMDYLESKDSPHGELTASNVFLSSDLCAKIGNFGFNVQVNRQVAGFDLTKTEAVRWAAPESWIHRHNSDIRSDVWSFGVVIFEVLTFGTTPYKEMKPTEVAERVEAGYRLPNPSRLGYRCDDVLYDTMVSCLCDDYTERPTFRELWFVFEDFITKHDSDYAMLE